MQRLVAHVPGGEHDRQVRMPPAQARRELDPVDLRHPDIGDEEMETPLVLLEVVPTVLAEMMSNPDKEKAGRAMEALLQMKKLDIAGLQRAFKGETAASRR
jgi:hypothetical protein